METNSWNSAASSLFNSGPEVYLLKHGTTQNDPKPAKTSQNDMKWPKTSQNDPPKNAKRPETTQNFKIYFEGAHLKFGICLP